MDIVGRALLILCFGVAVFGAVAALASLRGGAPRGLLPSARRALYAVMAMAVTCFVLLEIAFATPDFRYAVVFGHASETTPLFYRLTAPWASQEGSLLLWLTMLSITSTIAIRTLRGRMRDVEPYALAVLLTMAAFFAGLLVFAARPFELLPVAAPDGVGLSPLLRHPTMMMHPPLLYSGYTLFAVPFAFAIGALAAGRLGGDWIVHTRRFALAAWLLLGIGIILGARWSYAELGWGGYWAWDPVENASLMPWLTATAFIHTIVVQERRGMLKTWNVSLVLATGLLCLLGTFLVRSGVLSSIHAFGASTVGPPFLILIGGLLALSIGLVLWRRPLLQPDGTIQRFSRESMFLLGNLALIVLVIVIFWGTFFPLISEALTGEASAVGPQWFTDYATPSALAIVALSGLAPLVPWGRGRRGPLLRAIRLPLAIAIACLTVALLAGVTDPPTVAMVFAAAFTVVAVTREYWLGGRTRRSLGGGSWPLAILRAIGGNRRRYGGYLVHAGLAILLLAAALSTALDTTKQQQVEIGERIELAGGRQVQYLQPTGQIVLDRLGRVEKIQFGAQLRVWRDGRPAETLSPTHEFFPSGAVVAFGPVGRFFEGEETTEVALQGGWTRDLWLAATPDSDVIVERARRVNDDYVELIEKIDDPQIRGELLARSLQGIVQQHLDSSPTVIVRGIDSPAVSWVWIGAIMMILGGLISLSQSSVARSRHRAEALARVGQELSKA